MKEIMSSKTSSVSHWVFFLVWIVSLVLSQITRTIFMDSVTFNPNLAFGVAIQESFIIPVIILFLLLILIWYFKECPQKIYEIVAFGMILGGGTSNLVERFIYDGQVADYWNIINISTINLADVFIVLGIIIILITLLRSGK